MAKSSVYELWVQAGGGTLNFDRDRFLELMREHGHIPSEWPACSEAG